MVLVVESHLFENKSNQIYLILHLNIAAGWLCVVFKVQSFQMCYLPKLR